MPLLDLSDTARARAQLLAPGIVGGKGPVGHSMNGPTVSSKAYIDLGRFLASVFYPPFMQQQQQQPHEVPLSKCSYSDIFLTASPAS